MNIYFGLFTLFACLQSNQCLGFLQTSPIVRHASLKQATRSSDFRSVTSNQRSQTIRCSLSKLMSKIENKEEEVAEKEPSAFDQVASKGLAGVLAIAAAEA
jgi:hypothetical protein